MIAFCVFYGYLRRDDSAGWIEAIVPMSRDADEEVLIATGTDVPKSVKNWDQVIANRLRDFPNQGHLSVHNQGLKKIIDITDDGSGLIRIMIRFFSDLNKDSRREEFNKLMTIPGILYACGGSVGLGWRGSRAPVDIKKGLEGLYEFNFFCALYEDLKIRIKDDCDVSFEDSELGLTVEFGESYVKGNSEYAAMQLFNKDIFVPSTDSSRPILLGILTAIFRPSPRAKFLPRI